MAVIKKFTPTFFSAFWLVMMVVIWLVFAPRQAGGSASYVIVIGNSMEPRFHIGDLVIAHTQAAYQVGDAVVYRNRELGSFVFHRIIAEETGTFTLQGDNNSWIDTYQPARVEVIGKLWLHIPQGGTYIQKLRNPFVAATAAGTLAGFLALGLFQGKPGGKKRMANKSISEQFASIGQKIKSWFTVSGRSGEAPQPIQGSFLEGWFFALGTLAIASLIAGIIAFSRPASHLVTDDVPFEHVGFFSYTSPAPQGVYDSNTIQSGDPIFPRITCAVDVSFQYTFLAQGSGTIAGSHQLTATIFEPVSGWRRSVPLEEVVSFSSNAFGATAKLNLCQMEKLTQSMEDGTDFHPGSYILTVSPKIQVTGDVSGLSLESAFDPSLSFYYDRVHFYLIQEDAETNPLNPTASGAIGGQRQAANTVLLFGAELAVPAMRWFAVIGLAGSLAGLFLLGARVQSLSRRDPNAYIRARYESLLVDVRESGMADRVHAVDVASVEDLAKLAEKFNTIVLHTEVNGSHLYTVRAEGTVYRFVVPIETGPTLPEKDA